MCTKTEARAAHNARVAAIDRFAMLTEAMPPAPAMATDSPMMRAVKGIAEIYRGAAATVPLPIRRKGKV